MVGWVLLVFVVLLSGLLAYWGDIVGRKLGKKRLTVGRLRPRHTAAIMTALFGMIGSAIAIGAMLLVSEPVRAMLFEGDKVQAHLTELLYEQKKLKGDLAQKQGELEHTKNQVKTQENKVVEEQGKLQLARKDVAGLRAFAAILKREAVGVKSQLRMVRSQLTVLKPEIEKLKQARQSLNAELKYAQGDLLKFQEQN